MAHQITRLAVFWSKKTSSYVIQESIHCSHCDEILQASCIVRTRFFGSQSIQAIFCPKCWANAQKDCRDKDITRPVSVVEHLPRGAYPVLDLRPTPLGGISNISVFDAVDLSCDETVDNTKFAGRESIEGAKIGKPLLEKKDESCEWPQEEVSWHRGTLPRMGLWLCWSCQEAWGT